jgi:hypothetical protein
MKPKGPLAAQWRKRKYDRLRQFSIPDDLLPGSLTCSRIRCGKPNCRCANGEGHPNWTLTFMSDGKRRTLHIPEHLAGSVQRQVDAGRQFQNAVRDVLTANAELLALERRQARLRKRTPRT